MRRKCGQSMLLSSFDVPVGISDRCSSVLERMHSDRVAVVCHAPRNLAHAHTPAFLVGLLSWAA